MTEEELNKPVTLNNLMETLVTFNEEKAIPRLKEAMKEMLDDQFDNKVKPEIIKAKQEMMDYTDKRVGGAEGRINPKLNRINQQLDTLTNVLRDKNVIDEEDVKKVQKAGVAA